MHPLRSSAVVEEREDEPPVAEQYPFEKLRGAKGWRLESDDNQAEKTPAAHKEDPEEAMGASVAGDGRLPDKLLAPKPRLLAELDRGEMGYVVFTELFVLPDRSCFLNLGAQLRSKNASAVQVRRADDGGFHAVVPSDTTYEPGKLRPRSDLNLVPVASITIGPPSSR